MASVLVNGQANCGSGVFWQIGSSATIGSNTAMVGDVLANQSITFTGVNTSLVGGAFANVAAVTMTGTSITTCGGTLPPPPHEDHGHHYGQYKDHEKCNQGVGNGPEGCDPGNSNLHNPFRNDDDGHSNDENGGKPGNPGRQGGNK
jgi:hypothetical protein